MKKYELKSRLFEAMKAQLKFTDGHSIEDANKTTTNIR